jgi:hypothetical protein
MFSGSRNCNMRQFKRIGSNSCGNPRSCDGLGRQSLHCLEARREGAIRRDQEILCGTSRRLQGSEVRRIYG